MTDGTPRPARRRRLVILGLALVAVAAVATGLALRARHDERERALACTEQVRHDRARHVQLRGRAYDILVTSQVYVVGTSTGVVAIDPCSFQVLGECADAAGAHALAPADDGAIDYRRSDGTLATCRWDGEPVTSRAAESSDVRLSAQKVTHGPGARAAIRDATVVLEPTAERPRPLTTGTEPLGVALSPDARTLAVSDRGGIVTLFTVPGGLARARWQAHARNAYAVAWDPARERVVSVGGDGELSMLRVLGDQGRATAPGG